MRSYRTFPLVGPGRADGHLPHARDLSTGCTSSVYDSSPLTITKIGQESHYAWRCGVELTIKELKSGLHLGRMQVTSEAEHVTRSVVSPVCAYLVLLHLYGG